MMSNRTDLRMLRLNWDQQPSQPLCCEFDKGLLLVLMAGFQGANLGLVHCSTEPLPIFLGTGLLVTDQPCNQGQ